MPLSGVTHDQPASDAGPFEDDPAARLDCAVNGLRQARPDLSAAEPLTPWQKRAALLLFAVLVVAITAGGQAPTIALAILAPPFLAVATLRIIALWHLGRRRKRTCAAIEFPGELPIYTVLVPLYREAAVVPNLLRALAALDYPPDKLDILIIIEADDGETRAALAALAPDPPMRTIVVPEGLPRTKPRALCFALTYARGDYLVVYDAEDEPAPDQLKRALAAFQADPERLGCVQAHLDIYNAHESWLTRQFTIEYAALFHAILPTLQRLELPVPLGGTSNHFPRRVLESVGRWDPFNVTEDADLGMRLARAGWRIGVLASATEEEAPEQFGIWLKQRTRWLKGWMQTYLVHMRAPKRLWRELGARRFLGFQVMMGGVVLSALVHPWFYAFLGIELWRGHLWWPQAGLGAALWWVAAVNLLVGYVAAIALGVAAVASRGRRDLARHAVVMPLYWLAISFAAYRALLQLVRAPHLWEKTEHRPRRAGDWSARRSHLAGQHGPPNARMP